MQTLFFFKSSWNLTFILPQNKQANEKSKHEFGICFHLPRYKCSMERFPAWSPSWYQCKIMNHRLTRISPLPVPSLEKKHLSFYHRQDIYPKPALCIVLDLISVNVKIRKPQSSPHDSRWVHTNTFISAFNKLRRSVVLTKVQVQYRTAFEQF